MLGFSIFIAIVLNMVGFVSAYLGYASGSKIGTAFIPVAFGSVILVSSLIGRSSENLKKHMMHLNMGVALLGVILVLTALGMSGAFTKGFRSVAQAIGLIGMMVACIALLIGGVRSFAAARAART
jgi:hypothetical protein